MAKHCLTCGKENHDDAQACQRCRSAMLVAEVVFDADKAEAERERLKPSIQFGVNANIGAMLLPALRAAARGCGYALTLHGSMQRDIDLVAVPWVQWAVRPCILVEKLRAVAGGFIKDADFPSPGAKPHGRLCYPIHLTGQDKTCIDLSVMPRTSEFCFYTDDWSI